MRIASCAALGLFSAITILAQTQSFYTGSNITGQLTRTAVVNLSQVALQVQGSQVGGNPPAPDVPRSVPLLHPPVTPRVSVTFQAASTPVHSLTVTPSAAFGFNGITHSDQRLANGGNQFSVEPPSPQIAVANGFVLEGVNNAVRVYTTAGVAVVNTVASNQLFGLPAAINRSNGINGVFPTDMRVFYDQGINRFIVLQRAQDQDTAGNPLSTSHIYMAVSQTGDPTASYNVYTMDTTNGGHPGCPCLADYPQIGADQYGFYISANEYDTTFNSFVDASMLVISKAALGSGTVTPPVVRFTMPFSTGFEFAIQPASVPPGASNLVSNGGVEYFLSTQASFSFDSSIALWAMSNTSSIALASPNLLLTQTTMPSITYQFPDVAVQRPGPLPYGSTLSPPGVLAFVDGNDSRMLSVSYAGGRLYATFASQVNDENHRSLVGGVYMIISPTLRSGLLNGSVLRQGYLVVTGNHLLRPAVAVNAQGSGAVAFAVTGPDYFPSAGFVPLDTVSTGTTAQISAAGNAPEDGFSGYPGFGQQGVARWGDYSGAVVASDGSIWMVTEYIGNLPRTQLANWATFVTRYVP